MAVEKASRWADKRAVCSVVRWAAWSVVTRVAKMVVESGDSRADKWVSSRAVHWAVWWER